MRLAGARGALLLLRVRAHRVRVHRLAEWKLLDRQHGRGFRARVHGVRVGVRVYCASNGGAQCRLRLRSGGVEQRPFIEVAYALLGHFIHLWRALLARSIQLVGPDVQNLQSNKENQTHIQ